MANLKVSRSSVDNLTLIDVGFRDETDSKRIQTYIGEKDNYKLFFHIFTDQYSDKSEGYLVIPDITRPFSAGL